MSGRAFVTVALALLAGLFTVFLYAKPGAALPRGFNNIVVTNVSSPTALAFIPSDRRMLVTTKAGQLRVYERGTPGTTQALDISAKTCSGNTERGLLGAAVDPNFGSNHYLYLYYTYKKHGVCTMKEPNSPVNRVSRFTMTNGTASLASEEVLIDNIPSPNGNHNGGDLHFGKDGYLYVSVGDGGCDYAQLTECGPRNDASRDRHVLLGKVLRITRDGEIPSGNPYVGTNSDRCNVTGRTVAGRVCQEIFAFGLRNPFRMAFDPDAAGTSFRINDVGQNAWEEIDRGSAGADYGWNLCEGRHDNPARAGSVNCSVGGRTAPIHEYSHDTGCTSITGGAFVPDDGSWPDSYDNAYLFADFICDKIFVLKPKSGGGLARTLFATDPGGGGPVAMRFGPHGSNGTALYYTTFADGGKLRRITYSGS
jgi:glucose/arabinose dehydrogenase